MQHHGNASYGGDLADHSAQASSATRRQFLARAGGGSIALGLAPLLAACGSSSSSSKGGWAAAPVTFVFLDTQDPSHLDPAYGTEFDEFHVHRAVFEPLVDVDDAKAKLVPALAERWSSADDDTTHIFELRSNVVFHDGSKLDASVVKQNLERVMAIGQGQAHLLGTIKSIRASGPLKVVITTDRTDPWLPAHLVKFGIVSGEALSRGKTAKDPHSNRFVEKNPIGSGPYVFKSFEKGSQIVLEKNKDWWNKASWRPGSIDRVIIKPVAEAASRVQLIEQGEADFCTEWSIRDAVRVGKKSGFSLLNVKTPDTNPLIALNCSKPPFNDKRLRQAVQYAFDYAAMKDYFSGYAEIPTGPIPPFHPGGAKDLEPLAQDLPKAKTLLQQAGVDPASLKVRFAAPAGYEDLQAGATITQSSLKQIGIAVEINSMPFGQISETYAKPESAPELSDLYNSPFTLDPTQFLQNLMPKTFFNSFAAYDNPAVTKLIDELQQTGDNGRRDELLRQVQHTVRDDAPFVWGSTPHTLVALPDFVTGYQMQVTDFRFPCRFAQLRIKAH